MTRDEGSTSRRRLRFSETRSAQILFPVPGKQHRMGDKAVAQQRRLGILLELLYFFHLACSSSRLGHGPLKAVISPLEDESVPDL